MITTVLAALLANQAMTDQTLKRIEEKLDRLAAQSFENPLRAGLRMLGDASPEWRTTAERDRLLREAHYRFVDATAAAPDRVARAYADWHVELEWLLSRSTQDCWSALERARQDAFAR